MPFAALLILLLLPIWSDDPTPTGTPNELLIQGQTGTELAPHGEGNVYAPEVHVEKGRYRMWYGGQGRDGHDRIHLAESDDGQNWVKQGVVLEDPEANHVNDPSLVRVGGTYSLFYTRAAAGHHR